jgi:hypothetical protein
MVLLANTQVSRASSRFVQLRVVAEDAGLVEWGSAG